MHQLCALFNGRRNISDAVAYVCPICLTDKRRCGSSGEQIIASADTNRKMAAVDLPQTTLTRFLEERIEARLALAYSEAAEKSGISVDNVEKCPNLSLRLVSSYDKSHIVREGTYVVFYPFLYCLLAARRFISSSSSTPCKFMYTLSCSVLQHAHSYYHAVTHIGTHTMFSVSVTVHLISRHVCRPLHAHARITHLTVSMMAIKTNIRIIIPMMKMMTKKQYQ